VFKNSCDDSAVKVLLREVRLERKFEGRVTEAIDLAVRYGGIDGGHHKMWVIDQMVRVLAGDGYEELVREAKEGEDGPDTYDWDEGIAP